MATQYEMNEFRKLARNLIETIGPDRALHAARQYGWIDVAEVIRLEIRQTDISEKSTVAH